MRKKQIRGFSVMVVIVVMIGAAVSYAGVKYRACMETLFYTGGIDVSVAAYMMKEGREVMLIDDTVIDRYGKVSYIPRIANNGESCYLRVKITADTELGKDMDISKALCGVDDKWQMKGEYFYFTEPLDSKKSVDICRGFTPSHNWLNEKSKKININVTVDAVQSKNLKPDFRLEEPWGNVEISSSYKGKQYTVNRVKTSREMKEPIKILDADKKGEITVSTKALFSGITFMPGDEYGDTFTLSNDTAHRVKVMLKAECRESTLSHMMQLSIDNGSNFYEGPLAGRKLKSRRTIAVLEAGEKRDIHVRVSLPENADNTYAVRDSIAVWHFTAEHADGLTQGSTVETADRAPLTVAACLCLICMAVILIIRGKQDEKRGKKDM